MPGGLKKIWKTSEVDKDLIYNTIGRCSDVLLN